MFAPNIESFIGLRFLQAVGGCAGMIVSRAIISDLFDEAEGGRALSTMMLIQGVGPIVAPVLGGYLVTIAHWRAVFGFLALFGTGSLLLTFFYVSETLPSSGRRTGAIGQIAGDFGSLLSTRAFIVPALASSFALGGLFAFITGSPFVFMSLHGASPKTYGLLFGLNALGMVAESQLNRAMLRRFSASRIFSRVIMVSAGCSACLVLMSTTPSLPLLMVPLLPALACVPLLGANGIALAMSASEGKAGTASAIVGVLQFGIASVMSALVGVLHNGTAFPMTGLVFACNLAAALVFVGGCRRR